MRIQLQSILKPTDSVCNVGELYYHDHEEKRDYDGYFNLFYIKKRKAYTNILSVQLMLVLYGYEVLTLYHDRKPICKIHLEAWQKKEYTVDFPYSDYEEGVFWFSLTRSMDSSEYICEGYYTGEVNPKQMREVNIGIDICTYRRENYIEKNLRILKKDILENRQLDVSAHLRIYVIDNGKTLHQHEDVLQIVDASEGKITICPNMNAGGSGGFTRGMIEILKQKELYRFTHVLLMDDDATIEPDTVVRIYGMLRTLKDEWKDMTIGGAIMREDAPYMVYTAGEEWKKGGCHQIQKDKDVRTFKAAACEHLTDTGHEHDHYSGWWCCCYSLNVVRPDNLPLPLFLHLDDIEFGLRNRKYGICFLNGVGVWHPSFETKKIPGAGDYYDARNFLLGQALLQDDKKYFYANKWMLHMITSRLLCYQYQRTELVYQGVKDFLKGPDWLQKCNPVKKNSEVRKRTPSFMTYDEAKKYLSDAEYFEMKRQINEYKASFDISDVFYVERSLEKKMRCLLACIGWILPCDRTKITVMFPADSFWKAFRKKKVVFCDVERDRVILLEKDYKELFFVLKKYVKMRFLLHRYFNRRVDEYTQALPEMTNMEFWERYLKLR